MPNPTTPPGGERHRDEQRDDRGPVYHGARSWEAADDEADREALRVPAEDEVEDTDTDPNEQLADPGARGAAVGRGGTGIVERDQGPTRKQRDRRREDDQDKSRRPDRR